tara:strand:- start:1297 stop:1536 length:240 start_codon:yes stop_codon:yes gene_type:complete
MAGLGRSPLARSAKRHSGSVRFMRVAAGRAVGSIIEHCSGVPIFTYREVGLRISRGRINVAAPGTKVAKGLAVNRCDTF